MITRYFCPYKEPEGCGWEMDTQFIVDISIVEEVIREHLDEEHPGWTMEELERLKEERDGQVCMREGPIGIGPKARQVLEVREATER